MKSTLLNRSSLNLTAAAAAALMLASTGHAAENRGQRYSPGVGGSDMTAMLVPGWYAQVAMLHYHATKLKNNDGDKIGAARNLGAVAPGVDAVATVTKFRGDGYVALPRITYISSRQVLGANLGFTAMLPLIKRQVSVGGRAELYDSATGASLGAGPDGLNQLVNQGISDQYDGTNTGLGDLELSPVLSWELGDHQMMTLAPTIIIPTGEYNSSRAVNAGYGNFYSFRPSIQYGFIGDGWDVSGRAVLTFNTRNKDTKYRSGNMLNLDLAAMKFISEDIRVGLQGYVVQQLTKDSSDDAAKQAEIDAADGNKMRAYALGPAVGWLKNGGELLVEGKVMQEFGARNRSEGTSFWLTVSKPLGL